MAWLLLLLAAAFEIGWVIGLKETAGFTRLLPSIVTVVAMIASMGFLGLAVNTIPIGTGYAVWTGIGTVGSVAAGVALYGESADAPRLFCIGLIVVGIIGLKALTPG